MVTKTISEQSLYIFKEVNVPIYATKLTIAIIEHISWGRA